MRNKISEEEWDMKIDVEMKAVYKVNIIPLGSHQFPASEPPQHIVAAHIFDFTINLLIVIPGELPMQYHQIIYREVFLCLRRQKSEAFWNFWEKI